jgi:hypothetical protein
MNQVSPPLTRTPDAPVAPRVIARTLECRSFWERSACWRSEPPAGDVDAREPRFHTVRYAGVLASASRLRPRIVPPRDSTEDIDADTTDDDRARGGTRWGWRPWAELMKRVFEVDLEKCQRCGAPMNLRGDHGVSERRSLPAPPGRTGAERSSSLELSVKVDGPARGGGIAEGDGEATELPSRAPARDPPQFRRPVVRRKLAEQLVLVA